MKTILGTLVLGVMVALDMQAQGDILIAPRVRVQVHQSDSPTPLLAEISPVDEPNDNKKDPAYKTYKAGYNAILDEAWGNAMSKFAEVISKYPTSEYIDDAEYWNAYALSHTNWKKAVDAYKKFIQKYPKSSYVDDALADLGNINQEVTISMSGDSNHVVVISSGGGKYSYGVAPSAAIAEGQMKKAEAMFHRQQDRHSFRLDRLRIPSMASFREYEMEKLDPETRVRIEALEAISEAKDDEKAFATLKEVALDRKQPIALRHASLDALTDFKKFDILPLYLDLAKNDTSEKIQSAALEYIAEGSNDKNKSVDLLVSVYNTTPRERNRKLQTVLFIIADVGNDKAVDFLANVARTDGNYELRSDAVYYLGTIGGEKARSALYQILRNK